MIECASKTMALTALDTIAASMKGMEQEALLAVKSWVQENAHTEIPPETLKELAEIFNSETDGDRKAREWWGRG